MLFTHVRTRTRTHSVKLELTHNITVREKKKLQERIIKRGRYIPRTGIPRTV